MKKILALFVLALFVAGMLPIAFAEDTAAETSGSEDTADASTADAPARVKERLEKRGEALGNAREKAREAKEKVLENRERLIEAKDALLEKHKARVAKLVEKCRETGKTEEECKAMFEKRLENIAALGPKFREKLKEFEEKKAERVKKLRGLKDDEVLGKFEKAKEFKARVIGKAKIAKAQAEAIKAKEKLMQAEAGLDKAKLRLEQAKAAKICKTSPESEECAKAKEELRNSAKEKLSKHADIIISSLENAKEKVAANEYVSDEDEASAVAFLDGQITAFAGIKAEIESAQTKEEIVAAAKKLSEAWKEAKHKVNAYLRFLANSRMAGIVVKTEHLTAKLERVLERMAENGKDTAAVEPLVAEFKANIGAAKEKFKAANALLLEIRTAELSEEDKKAKEGEAKQLLEDARESLKDANETLRQIFKALKDLNATEELAAATAAEDVETEAEEEADPADGSTAEEAPNETAA